MAKDRPGILLVNPSATTVNYISLAYIAGYARAHGFRADVIDFASEKLSPLRIQDICRAKQPILIGIAAYQRSMNQVVSAAKLFKKISSAKIVIGGPQIPAMPDEGLRQLADVDFLCRGEGEITTLALLEGLWEKTGFHNVSGISYKLSDGSIRTTSSLEAPADLDEYPSPYLQDVIDIQAGGLAYILSSRGCPHACKFCVTPFLSKRRLRVHSIGRVISEMSYLNKKGVNHFWFADPAFSSDKERAIRLFTRIVESKIRARIWCETRYDMVDDGLLSLMKRAGVEKIAFGLETSNEEILKTTGKKLDVDRFAVTVKKTQAHGIKAEILHMIGFPGETLDSILGTFDYIRRLGIFFEGNSIGNMCNLYFGSDNCRDPEEGGFVISKKILDKTYPAYLSPGINFRHHKLTETERKKISLRREREMFLAACRSQYEEYRQKWGLSVQDAFSLPWDLINMLQDNFSAGESAEISADEPIERFFVLSNDAADSARSGYISTLKNTLNGLSHDFRLFFVGGDPFFLEEKKIFEPLLDLLSSSLLYKASIGFTLKCDYWNVNKKVIMRCIKHLTHFRLPSPIYDTSAGSWEYKKLMRYPLCSVIVLLDVTDGRDIDPSYLEEVRQALQGAGAVMLPFFDFKNRDSIKPFLEKNKRFEMDNAFEKRMMVGLARRGIAKELEAVYRDNRPSFRLPILQIMDGVMLYPGGKSSREDFSPAERLNSVYVDGQGGICRNLDELLEARAADFAGARA